MQKIKEEFGCHIIDNVHQYQRKTDAGYNEETQERQ